MTDNEDPGAGETNEPFCHAPGERCTDMSECYANKQCQYEPTDEGICFASMDAPPLQPCKADVHFGPVTVSGRSMRCSNCGYCWEIASEGAGPK